jgi:biotin transport system substrate-specific component
MNDRLNQNALAAAHGSHPGTLALSLWPRGQREGLLRPAVLVAVGVALLVLSAKLKVPFYPVPMTMQTLAVLLLGLAYGLPLGALTVASYLVLGAVGLPVFADTPEKGIGLAYMVGPTGGYLAGFLVAGVLAGALAERGFDRGVWRLGAVMLFGHAVILLLGWAWLAQYVGMARAWNVGVAPFHLATVLKSLMGIALMMALWRLPVGRGRAD